MVSPARRFFLIFTLVHIPPSWLRFGSAIVVLVVGIVVV